MILKQLFPNKKSTGQMDMSQSIVIVDYYFRWPLIYKEEKQRILTVVGHKVIGIEHIDSTAVVNLGAKPIIDIMAGVSSSHVADELLPLLREIGYTDVIQQSGHPEWYHCLKKVIHGKETWLQNFHPHLVKFRSKTWERHLLFRDFLRKHPETVQKYYEIKRMLSTKYGVDRESYTNAKTEFIASVVNQARLK